MSAPANKSPTFDKPTEAELAKWPGVTCRRERRSKHIALVLTFEGKSRTVVMSTTPGDRKAVLSHIGVVRTMLAELGATRAIPIRARRAPRKSRAKIRRPVGELVILRERPTHGRTPARDPFAASEGFEVRQPPPGNDADLPPTRPLPIWAAVVAILAGIAVATAFTLATIGRPLW